ncbi:DUF5700 domain-containing putative Zn-dependent protease [Paucisalibacillus sp. EB02]|uniref:DUF5700 domain-containing putative Zn-dependent protease n=1 Tax=Paucisalibacillus sp. EB02 TaxID=1347087 RepID=UPI0004B2E4FE|nr:DUF5700 domain-containing putative Zn-dependent protease [Paucisalibacillus sp. EB02]
MNINDTFGSFPDNLTIQSLRQYYEKHPDIFNFYFQIHCKNTDIRLNQAIQKYPTDWDSIEKVHDRIVKLIEIVEQAYQSNYQLNFPITVNLIVGAYGSNGYTNHKIIPDITLAMERLTYKEDPLKVLIAHEFGHAAHNIFSNKHHMDWKLVQWDHPYTWLLQEGTATHFSKQIVPDLNDSIYFSYTDNGDEWLKFARGNRQVLLKKFTEDLRSGRSNKEIFKEWFSINGGETFGFTRLGYFVADCMFQDFEKEIGEMDTLLLWKEDRFFRIVEAWLDQNII